MTNLLNLPQIPAGTSINLQSNVDWNDQFFVPVPGFAATPIVLTGALAGSTTFTVSSPGGVVPGMIAVGYGVPAATTVSSVGSGTITLNTAATITAPGATVTFLPPPMDLTGIVFSSILRTSANVSEAILKLSTADGTMTNGAAGGQFGWSVTAAQITGAPWPSGLVTQGALSCVLDIIATDVTGAKINLCALNGPIAVNISLSITR